MKIKIGDRAPNFKLLDQDEKYHELKNYRGKFILLYFYPKDNTSGCTKEACAIRDNFPKFSKLNAKVLGISIDNPISHFNFAEKFRLPFILLADTQKEVVKKYNVWAMKNFMGRKYWGTVRTSFLIDPQGKIAKVYKTVKPQLHAEEVLKDLETLQR